MLAVLVLVAAQADPALVNEPVGPPPPSHFGGASSPLGGLESEFHGLYTTLRPVLVEVRFTVYVKEPNGQTVKEDVVVSGVVIDEGGLVVSPITRKVKEGQLRVRDMHDREFAVELIAEDPAYGLSLLRVPGLDVDPPALGCADGLQMGSLLVSMGNGLGLPGTMDWGILSGKRRQVAGVSDLLQITNDINPGDGGGILSNRQGQLVGILFTSLEEAARRQQQVSGNRIQPMYHSARGVAFAVPIDRVLETFARFLSRSPLTRKQLGVEVNNQPLELTDPLHRATRTGLRVERVLPGSPAALAGIRDQDILLQADGNPVCSTDCLGFALSTCDEEMVVVVNRGGEIHVIKVRFLTAAKPYGVKADRRPTLKGNLQWVQQQKVAETKKKESGDKDERH